MAKAGRNAPCPCGSGKKYKKCCLTKDEQASYEAVRKEPEAPTLDASPPGLASRGRALQVHPYVAAKMVDRSGVRRKPPRGARGRMKELWTPSKVAALDTEEITRRLADHGVDVERERFLELAQSYTSAWELSRDWLGEVSEDRIGPDGDDFLGLAACELWKRFSADRPSVEMLDDWMEQGYASVYEDEDDKKACDRWWELWQVLSSRLTPSMRSTADADVLIAGTQHVGNWVQDFCDSLRNLASSDTSYAEMGVDLIRAILDQFPEENPHNRIFFKTELAFMCYRAGQDAEGEGLLLKLIEEHPDRAAGYACLADELSIRGKDDPRPPDYDRAIALLEHARDRPVVDAEDWDVIHRLEYLLEKKESGASSPAAE